MLGTVTPGVSQDTLKKLMHVPFKMANPLMPTPEEASPASQDGPEMLHTYTQQGAVGSGVLAEV